MFKITAFLNETKEELGKIVWPTKDQTIRYTILVITVTVAVGLFLGGLNYLLTLLTEYLVKKY